MDDNLVLHSSPASEQRRISIPRKPVQPQPPLLTLSVDAVAAQSSLPSPIDPAADEISRQHGLPVSPISPVGEQDVHINIETGVSTPPPKKAGLKVETYQVDSTPTGQRHIPNPHTRQKAQRPFYLRRRVILLFAVAFACCIAAIETLFVISERRQGLVKSSDDLYYLWTFGPTAIMTIISILWARVEFQAMRYMPWLALSRGWTPIHKSLATDYFSLFVPNAIYRSFKNRHYLVSVASLMSLGIKLVVVLSSGLFFLQPIQIKLVQPNMLLQSEFTTFDPEDDFPTYVPDIDAAIHQLNTSVNGRTESFAYQLFSCSECGDKPFVAEVEGFYVDFKCPTVVETKSRWDSDGKNIEFEALVPLCGGDENEIEVISGGALAPSAAEVEGVFNYKDFGLYPSSCQRNGSKILVATGTGDPSTNNTSVTALLCDFLWYKTPVRVTKTINTTSVEVISPPQWDPRAVDLGPNIDSFPGAMRSTWGGQGTLHGGGHQTDAPGNFDKPPPFRLAFQYLPSMTIGAAVKMNQAELESFMKRFFTIYSATVARYLLMQPTTRPSNLSGFVFVTENRLHVSTVFSQVITAILAVLSGLSIAMLVLVPRRAVLPSTSNSIVQTAILLSDSHELLSRLKGTGTASSKNTLYSLKPYESARLETNAGAVKIALQTSAPEPEQIGIAPENGVIMTMSRPRAGLSNYDPWASWTSIRIIGCVILAAAVITLASLLQLSVSHGGLGPVPNQNNIQYLWTALPTFLMALVSLYLSTYSSLVRSLTPFSIVNHAIPYNRSAGRDFIDDVGFRTSLHAIYTRRWPVLCVIVSVCLAEFLTVFTGTLYKPTLVPQKHDVRIQQVSWLDTGRHIDTNTTAVIDTDSSAYKGQTETLIMINNQSFPAWTYEDLIFPNFTLVEEAAMSTAGLGNQTIVATVVALRPQLDCRLYLDAQIPHDDPCGATSQAFSEDATLSGTWEVDDKAWTDSYIDLLSCGRYREDFNPNCQNILSYGWGSRDASNQSFSAALVCNQSLVTLDVTVAWKNQDLVIDETHPPIPNEATARNYPYSFLTCDIETFVGMNHLPLGDAGPNGVVIGSRNETHLLDNLFWRTLTWSKWGIPREYIRSPEHAEEVAEAVKFQHRMLMAHFVSQRNTTRKSFDQASSFDQYIPPSPTPITAILTDYTSLRLTQNANSTYFVVSLLASIGLLMAASLWATRPSLPKNPMSILSMASYLADSNVFDYLGGQRDRGWPEEKDLERLFHDKRFAMGWFLDKRAPVSRSVYTIGVLGDPRFPFGGNKEMGEAVSDVVGQVTQSWRGSGF
ncbi:hypothetical protein B0H66DRAFT_379885 [Apodospora peruviana]|uniref:Uncharacterized protein n=1 Tax=Apodospora peruviana TaxID=516989 RepID=A0AAE0HTP5_9PEZI|nr:hypothetical protein B0H66DRAFT_379885 [Apodospora peruviana]